MTRARIPVLWFVSALLLVVDAHLLRADVNRTTPEVTFRFERAGMPVPRYRITVAEDGNAIYEGRESRGTASREPPTEAQLQAALQDFRQTVTLSPGTTRSIFALTATLKQFHVNCATKARNIADIGSKSLEYKGPEGSGECMYNYSDTKAVMQLTDLFEGIAETMDEGRHLDELHRYDRLGLDEAISNLAEEVSAGRAVDLNTIAGTLRSIAGDVDVLQRVRLKASQLLSLLPPDMQSGRH